MVCVILTRRLFSKTFSFERESNSLGDKETVCLALSKVQNHASHKSQYLKKKYMGIDANSLHLCVCLLWISFYMQFGKYQWIRELNHTRQHCHWCLDRINNGIISSQNNIFISFVSVRCLLFSNLLSIHKSLVQCIHPKDLFFKLAFSRWETVFGNLLWCIRKVYVGSFIKCIFILLIPHFKV